jgi:GTP-binding protein Era
MSLTRAGYIALLGRPNVGKSTLLNRLIAQKISITSRKPQTTRHIILGIKTLPDAQFVYVDTPGIHQQAKRAINRYMNRVAGNTLGYVDVAILLLEALRWTDEDHDVLKRLQTFSGPVIAAVNKVDRVKDKAELLPFLKELNGKHNFLDIVPLSALRNDNVDVLEKLVAEHLPPSNFLFSEDQITTASQRFLAGELIREKLTRLLRDELPYALTVEIENFSETGNLIRIGAVIWVERAGQKGIVIGSGGEVLKKAGQQARADMEKIFDRRIFLETWVKVRSGWSDDERALHQFGYREES